MWPSKLIEDIFGFLRQKFEFSMIGMKTAQAQPDFRLRKLMLSLNSGSHEISLH